MLLLLLGFPLAGVALAGRDITAYLEFPPRTRYVEHAPFSWPVFIGLAVTILAVIAPFLIRIGRVRSPGRCQTDKQTVHRTAPARPFPWWGWLALILGILFWVLAWTRFAWFEPLQLYTFSPLWLAYIAVMNALTFRRTGRCMMTHETRFFFALFLLSAAFWWLFEYLNRFVQNWYYVKCGHFSPLQYFVTATLPFSTVLPAVLSTEAWLAGHPRCSAGLDRFVPLRINASRRSAAALLALSLIGLLLIGVYPNQLYPLLWVAPMLLIIALQYLTGGSAFFPELTKGGEMWNDYSLAKWIYTVPYVHRFQLFEMPLLGYAGYLPFGLECAVIADLIRRD
jgi:hypothetical protein